MDKQDQEITSKDIWDQLDAEDAGRTAPEPKEPAKQDESPAEPVAAQAAPDKEQKADDSLDSLPQSVRDEIHGMRTMVVQLQDRVRKSEGRLGELNATLKQQVTAAQDVRDAGGSAPSAGQLREANSSPEKFQKLRDDYPDFAEAIEEYVSAREGKGSDGKLAQLEEQMASDRALSDLERRRMTVEFRHPGWADEVKTPKFAGWLDRQPPEIKMLADSNEPAAAIRVLDLFKADGKPAPRQTNHDLEAAAALPNGRRSAPRAKPIDEMTGSEYWAYLDALEADSARAARR